MSDKTKASKTDEIMELLLQKRSIDYAAADHFTYTYYKCGGVACSYHANGVPCCSNDYVGTGDNAWAFRLELPFDVIDEVVAEEAAVLYRRLLRVGPVEKKRCVAALNLSIVQKTN